MCHAVRNPDQRAFTGKDDKEERQLSAFAEEDSKAELSGFPGIIQRHSIVNNKHWKEEHQKTTDRFLGSESGKHIPPAFVSVGDIGDTGGSDVFIQCNLGRCTFPASVF